MLVRHNPEVEILESLHANASKHANASDGLFVVDEFEPKSIPSYMRLGVSSRHYENMRAIGHRLPAKQLGSIAPFVDRRITNLVAEDYEITDPEHQIALSTAGELLSNGYNVALGQSHGSGEPTDIAFDLGVKSIHLERAGIEHKTAIILSKGFDFLKINTANFTIDQGVLRTILKGLGMKVDHNGLIPLRSFIGVVADVSYFVIPGTESFRAIRERQAAKIRNFNDGVVELIQQDLTQKDDRDTRATLLSLALTGTTAKPIDAAALKEAERQLAGAYEFFPPIDTIPDGSEVYAIGRINHRVTEYLKHCFTFASGIVLDEDPDMTRHDIRPKFIVVKDADGVRKIGAQLTESLDILMPGITFVQDIKQNITTPQQNASS